MHAKQEKGAEQDQRSKCKLHQSGNLHNKAKTKRYSSKSTRKTQKITIPEQTHGKTETPPQKRHSTAVEKTQRTKETQGTDKTGTKKETQTKTTNIWQKREALVKMGNGLRAMTIAILNNDSVKGEQTKRDITKNLTRNEIHISAIQETRIIHDRDYTIDNYRATTAAAAKRAETGAVQGGTEVTKRARMQKYITQIARKGSRVARVTMGRKNSRMPIQLLTTYAPRNGHTEADRRQHWEDVKEILNKTCKRHMIIGCSAASGEIGRDREAEENTVKKMPRVTL